MLHDDWWIWVLRPNSVSTGWTLRQFDFTPQSPHPSQTASLMYTRIAGSGSLPRLRKRRFSAAFFDVVKNYYAPYGLRSAPWWYSLYLQRYVKEYNVPPEAAGAVALACRAHAQLNDKAMMRGKPGTS